jgi:hypothetical protein
MGLAMPDLVMTALISGIVSVIAGAIAGYLSASHLATADRTRRRAAVASVLLYELRLMEANMRDTATASQPSQQAIGVSYPMHDALLPELVLFKPTTVQAVLAAYGWFRDYRHKVDLVRRGVLSADPEQDREIRIRAGHGVVAVPAAFKALVSEGGVEPGGRYWASRMAEDPLPQSPFKAEGPDA